MLLFSRQTEHDIAILKLSEEIDLEANAKIISVAIVLNSLMITSTVKAFGWGRTTTGNNLLELN